MIRFEARDGAVVDLSNLQSATEEASGDLRLRAIHFIADGLGSLVDLGALTEFTDLGETSISAGGGRAYSSIGAIWGGRISAPAIQSIRGVNAYSDLRSEFPIPQLVSASDSLIQLTGQGSFELPNLTDGEGTAIRIDGYQVSLPELASISRGELSVVGGGNAEVPKLTNIDSATLIVEGGVTLSIPSATSIVHDSFGSNQTMVLRAEGYGSVLDLANVTTMTGGEHYGAFGSLQAFSGGMIHFPSLTSIAETTTGDQRYRRFELLSEGVSSLIDLPSLQSIIDPHSGSTSSSNRSSSIESRFSGRVRLGSLGTDVQMGGAFVTAGHQGTLEGDLHVEPNSILTGEGQVIGDVTIEGLLDPNGLLTIDGGLELGETGLLEFEIGGLTPVIEHDVLDVTGEVTFDGTIATNPRFGYQPDAGDSYLTMTFGSRVGSPTYIGLDFGSQLLTPELSPTTLEFITGFSSGAAVTAILASDSSVNADGPFLTIAFDEPMDPTSFSGDDVVLIGPGGATISVESIEPLGEFDTRVFVLRPQTDLFVDGEYSITIGPDVLDFVGNPMNQDEDEINGEPIEDQFTSTFTWTLPDLDLVGGVLTTSETAYQFGEEVDLLFDVTNAGLSEAGGSSWTDRIYLSTDTTLDAADVLLTSVSRFDPLASGESYQLDLTFSLPLIDSLVAGPYYLLASIDDLNQISESDEANVYASSELDLTFPPLVDLLPTEASGPTEGQPRQSAVFQWTVTNQGDQPTNRSWYDRVYAEPVNSPGTLYTIGTAFQNRALAPGQSYSSMMTVALPNLDDGEYRIVVWTDYSNRNFEGPYEGNNQIVGNHFVMTHPDIEIRNFDAPASANTGQLVELTWDFLNSGTATADAWQQSVYLSEDQTLSGNDRLIESFAIDSPLAPGQTVSQSRSVRMPVDLDGNRYLLLVNDTANQLGELTAGENNNVAAQLIELTLSPYADLAVSDVTAPQLTIGDPAEITVGWTVTNLGVGRGFEDQWTDAVVLSRDDVVGNADDLVIRTVERNGGLDENESYTRNETFRLPPELSGRFTLFVRSDFGNVVFENEFEANNDVARVGEIDIMPAPNADLIVESVDVPLPVVAGGVASLTWSIRNDGIGVTNRGDWYDRVFLSTTPDASGIIGGTALRFQHFGQVAPGGSYARTGEIQIPDGLSGDHFLVVQAAERNGPFEFIYTDNNIGASAAFPITLLPPPDLVVAEVIAPTEAEEGTLIDIRWTVDNIGLADAVGGWTDRVFLQEAGNPNGDIIELGRFPFVDPVIAGQRYERSERVRIPTQSTGTFNLFIDTNFNDALYEGDGREQQRAFGPNRRQRTSTTRPACRIHYDPRPFTRRRHAFARIRHRQSRRGGDGRHTMGRPGLSFARYNDRSRRFVDRRNLKLGFTRTRTALCGRSRECHHPHSVSR